MSMCVRERERDKTKVAPNDFVECRKICWRGENDTRNGAPLDDGDAKKI